MELLRTKQVADMMGISESSVRQARLEMPPELVKKINDRMILYKPEIITWFKEKLDRKLISRKKLIKKTGIPANHRFFDKLKEFETNGKYVENEVIEFIDKELLSAGSLAEKLQVPYHHVTKMARSGIIPTEYIIFKDGIKKKGGKYKFLSSVTEYLESVIEERVFGAKRKGRLIFLYEDGKEFPKGYFEGTEWTEISADRLRSKAGKKKRAGKVLKYISLT